MARAGTLEKGQNLQGSAKLEKVGQNHNLFSDLREEDDWRKYKEFVLSLSSPCVPSKREGGRRIANIQKDKPAASLG